MRNYNSQAFTPEEVEQGLLNDLLNYLLDHNKKNKEQYYDIHITTDGYCSIVEWTDVVYGQKFGPEGKFQFVDCDQVVMLEKYFPDNHCEVCYDEEDYEERLKEFLEKNPGWEKTEYGTWTNRIENEQIKKWLEGERYKAEEEIKESDRCSCEQCVDDANNPTKDCSTCPHNHEDMDGDICSKCEEELSKEDF